MIILNPRLPPIVTESPFTSEEVTEELCDGIRHSLCLASSSTSSGLLNGFRLQAVLVSVVVEKAEKILATRHNGSSGGGGWGGC